MAAVLFSTTFVSAQTTLKKTKTEKTTTTVHLKKDGTPDKRFKENKKTTVVHVKKDGTPDKRYKENKKTTTKTVIKKK